MLRKGIIAEDRMKKYETIVVFTTTLNESELTAEINKVQALLESNGAQDVSIQRWGRKEIAYTVKKQRFGNFVVYNFTSDQSDTIDKTSRILVITDAVLKFQTHVISDRRRKVKSTTRPSGSMGSDDLDDVAVDADY